MIRDDPSTHHWNIPVGVMICRQHRLLKHRHGFSPNLGHSGMLGLISPITPQQFSVDHRYQSCPGSCAQHISGQQSTVAIFAMISRAIGQYFSSADCLQNRSVDQAPPYVCQRRRRKPMLPVISLKIDYGKPSRYSSFLLLVKEIPVTHPSDHTASSLWTDIKTIHLQSISHPKYL